MSSTCSQRATHSGTGAEANGGAAAGEFAGIMLFGVRLTADGSSSSSAFRKSASMNNLAQFDQPQDSNADLAGGYASDDVVHASGRSRERKRGVPWTEEEHMLFLKGLQKVGKGDWRGISRNFVKTRTPTQVASHAQKYFLRRNNHHNRRRRRSSLFDITTDAAMGSPLKLEGQAYQKAIPQPPLRHISNNHRAFPATLTPAMFPNGNSIETPSRGESNRAKKQSPSLIRPIPILPIPPSSRMADLNLNRSPPPSDQKSPESAFQAMNGGGAFNSSSSGDSIISVA